MTDLIDHQDNLDALLQVDDIVFHFSLYQCNKVAKLMTLQCTLQAQNAIRTMVTEALFFC